MARKRTGGIKLRTRLNEGGYSSQNGGVALSTDYQGNYSLLIEVDTDKTKTIETANGTKEVPVRARLAAGKFIDEDGDVIKIDFTNTFINLNVWETMEARPPRD